MPLEPPGTLTSNQNFTKFPMEYFGLSGDVFTQWLPALEGVVGVSLLKVFVILYPPEPEPSPKSNVRGGSMYIGIAVKNSHVHRNQSTGASRYIGIWK